MTDYKRKSNANHRQNANQNRSSVTRNKKNRKHKKQTPFQQWLSKHTAKICIGLTAAIVVILVTLIVTVAMTLSYDKVYDGIYLNDQKISYMSKDELHTYIEEKYSNPISNITIHITSGTQTWDLDASDLNITFNIDTIVDSIYNHGHVGSVVQRLNEIYTMRTQELHINIFEGSEDEEPLVNYDESVIDTLAEKITQTAPTTPVQHQVQVSESQISIIAGSNGYTYDVEAVKNALLLAVNDFQSASLDLHTIATVTAPDPLDIDATMLLVNKEPVNATYRKVSAKEIEIAPEQYGFSVARADLEAVAAQLNTNQGTSFQVPVTKINPSVYASDMKMPTYPDVLGEKTTKFGTSSSYKNRNTNLKVATETLDGYILLPGEQFSFNTYVGDTTLDKGYKMAAGYSGGRVNDTPGGGICQVSTTLYNAVINSVNVDVNQRSNHSSTVSYVPKGLDCMINYNTNDFKFTNNTNYPIKIDGEYDPDGNLTYRIIGVNEHKDIRYEYISTQTSTTQPKVKYTTDPAEVQSGLAGGKWSVERVTYQNGVEIKREPFSKSSYKAMDKIVLKNPATPTPTKPADSTTTPAPTTPSPTEPPMANGGTP